jgi:hypothetical protein
MKKKIATVPIVTKKTKSSESSISTKPSSKGMSKPVGTPITKKKGINPTVTRHKFMRNAETYM